MISIDLSLFVEIVLFIFLMITLDHLMYRPILEKIRHRNERLDQEKQTLEEILAGEKTLKDTMDKRLSDARREADRVLQESIDRVGLTYREKSDRLIGEITAKTQMVSREIDQAVRKTRTEMERNIEPLARQFIRKLLPLVFCAFLVGVPLTNIHAAEHAAAGEHSEEHEGGISETWRTINFVLMVSILVFLTRKPISRAFADRSQGIDETLRKSAGSVENARREMADLESRLARVDTEASRIVDTGRIHAREAQQRLEQEEQARIEKIRVSGEKQVEMIATDAFKSVNRATVEKALAKTMEILSGGIDIDTDRKLVSDCIEKLDTQIRQTKEN